MAGSIKVSVLVVTYDHEQFIEQAISGVLAQDTDFEYEIVVGDDCSTDGTREILIRKQNELGDRMRLVLHSERLGPWANQAALLDECRGEYVAYLDGDDYWTSEKKLQRQVDVLDAHPACPMCCHNAHFLYEEGDGGSKPVQTAEIEPFLKTEELLVNSPAMTSTTMFRRGVALALRDVPTVLYGDKARAVIAAHRYGLIAYIDESMSMWRIHPGGLSSGKWKLPRLERRIRSHGLQIEFYEVIDRFLGYEYHDLICTQVVRRYYAMALAQARAGNWSAMLDYLRKGWSYVSLPSKRQSTKTIAKSVALMFLSAVAKISESLEKESVKHGDPRLASR